MPRGGGRRRRRGNADRDRRGTQPLEAGRAKSAPAGLGAPVWKARAAKMGPR
jgi:hypothetical protein